MTKGQQGQEEFDENMVDKPQNLACWRPFDKGNQRVKSPGWLEVYTERQITLGKKTDLKGYKT